jgi:hypothetical protein
VADKMIWAEGANSIPGGVTLQASPPLHPYVQEAFDAGLTGAPVARYIEMRFNGESPNMAAVLASRKFPGFSTNDDWMRGRENGRQFEHCPKLGDYYKSVAEASGCSVVGKFYCSGLAAYPGDPRAWVSDKSDVLSVARERNLTVDGIVKHQGHQVDPTDDIDIADDILARETKRLVGLGASPSVAASEAYDRLTGRVDSRPELLVTGNAPLPSEVGDE